MFPAIRHTARVTNVAISPAGNQVASASHDGTIRIWESTGGRQLACLLGHTDFRVECLAYAPDGKRLWSAAHDNSLRCWEVSSGRQTAILEQATSPYHISFCLGGKAMASFWGDGLI